MLVLGWIVGGEDWDQFISQFLGLVLSVLSTAALHVTTLRLCFLDELVMTKSLGDVTQYPCELSSSPDPFPLG